MTSGSFFVGRRDEMAALTTALDGAMAGQGRVFMLAGEPGIGKTRLAQALASHAQLMGGQVLWGWCYEREGAPPYWPWVQLLRSYIDVTDAEQLRSQLGPGGADIAEVVSDVREKLPDLDTPPALEPNQARFRLFDSLATFFKNAARSQPLMLVLDDLHWADKPSLLLLEYLSRQLAENRILIVGTYRDAEVTREHPLSETIAQLYRSPLFQSKPLQGLGSADVGPFLQAASGNEASQQLVEAIYAHTEGNPFFMSEVIKLLEERGDFEDRPENGAPVTLGIPRGVMEVIGQRVNRLSDQCVQMLTTASIIGREFDFGLLEKLNSESPELQGTHEVQLLESLDEALEARIINELPGQGNLYQFSHALTQKTMVENLSFSRKVRLHARIGAALEEIYSGSLEEHSGELSYHFAQASPVTGSVREVKYTIMAGELALRTYAYEDAMTYFLNGLAAMKVDLKDPRTVDDADGAALVYGLARAQASLFGVRSEPLIEAVANLKLAFNYNAGVGNLSQAVAIAQHPVRSPVGVRAGSPDLLESALEIVDPDSSEKGHLLAMYGRVKGLEDGDYKAAETALQESLEISSRLGDLSLEKRALAEAAQVDLYHFRLPDALLKANRAIQITAPENDLVYECAARFAAWAAGAWDCLENTNLVAAEAFLTAAEKLRDQFWLGLASWTFEKSAHLRGDWDGARRFNEKEITPMLGTRILTELETGNPKKAEEHLQQLVAMLSANPKDPIVVNAEGPLALGMAFLISGEPRGLDLLMKAAKTVTSSSHATPVFASFAILGQAAMAVAEADAQACSLHYQAASRFSGLCVNTVMCDRILGLLAHAMGKLELSVRHFEEALRLSGRAGYQPEYAWSCLGYADTLAKRNGPGDRDKAGSLLAEAMAIATRLGMPPLIDQATVLMEQTDSLPSQATAYPDGLTQREVEVLRLVSAGRTDREIGEELFISIRTVTTHVGNILNKTNAANRTEAAAYATRQGLA